MKHMYRFEKVGTFNVIFHSYSYKLRQYASFHDHGPAHYGLWKYLMCYSLQELYAKLNRMAGIAADMFVGRERFATLLMMRLTETVILWLSEDQAFWEEIEQGQKPLGPLGLQQVSSLPPFLFLLAVIIVSFPPIICSSTWICNLSSSSDKVDFCLDMYIKSYWTSLIEQWVPFLPLE
jgi:hypothetical protein